MIERRQLFVLLFSVILVGCGEASKSLSQYENAATGIGPNTGPVAGDNGGFSGSGFVPVGGGGGSYVDPGSGNNPPTQTNDAAGPPTPVDSGVADGARTTTTTPPITIMDSGTTTASDGGQSNIVDTGTSTATPDTGTSPPDPVNPNDPYDSVRQVCVDTINEYRATMGLAPMNRASAALEECSDQGAKKDGDTGVAHSSAGDCAGLGAQNTCPGYQVGGWAGATLADALKRCLAQMWAEGEPPQGRDQCVAEYRAGNTACFMAHGHYINMSNPSYGTVACGFYDMGNNTYWMNQNFGR
jgi:hypothetical protein